MHFLTDKLEFPSVHTASPEGIVAIGGDLSPARLLLAYQRGIFPWFNDDSLLLWWSPDPRMVLFPKEVKVSKSMKKVIRSNKFTITKNKCFEQVIGHCAKTPRKEQEGTWITGSMQNAYLLLHKQGYAVSYEVWENEVLVGGLYGIDLGYMFCGESMFSLTDNASKFAFIKLAEELGALQYKVIDCQVHTNHLESLGAKEISRADFIKFL